ncbi:SSU ribosomal protein S8p (S15Ae) [hydrothermal vent metagenome]|uniref:SSU ribosomal protein S8p (S15Ae) n=1 Tax=hydrothermal vent metagenome TaxID=652676 RepID=A0A3B0SUC6_9ZZZZ
MPSSKMKEAIAKVLVAEGYADSYRVEDASVGKTLTVRLRYNDDRSRVLSAIKRVSKPGLRVYKASNDIRRIRGGLGISIVSTSEGLLTDRDARKRSIGGEVLCEVW